MDGKALYVHVMIAGETKKYDGIKRVLYHIDSGNIVLDGVGKVVVLAHKDVQLIHSEVEVLFVRDRTYGSRATAEPWESIVYGKR